MFVYDYSNIINKKRLQQFDENFFKQWFVDFQQATFFQNRSTFSCFEKIAMLWKPLFMRCSEGLIFFSKKYFFLYAKKYRKISGTFSTLSTIEKWGSDTKRCHIELFERTFFVKMLSRSTTFWYKSMMKQKKWSWKCKWRWKMEMMMRSLVSLTIDQDIFLIFLMSNDQQQGC